MNRKEELKMVRSAHPVAPDVRARVLAELADIEHRHDVRFVYAHRRDWYLRVEPQRDVIERPLDDVLHVSGWELRKALQLLHRSNPTLLEWLDSPVVYREDIPRQPRSATADANPYAACQAERRALGKLDYARMKSPGLISSPFVGMETTRPIRARTSLAPYFIQQDRSG